MKAARVTRSGPTRARARARRRAAGLIENNFFFWTKAFVIRPRGGGSRATTIGGRAARQSRLLGVKGREGGGPEDVEAESPEVPPAGVGVVPDLLAPRTLSDAAASHVRFFSPPILGPE